MYSNGHGSLAGVIILFLLQYLCPVLSCLVLVLHHVTIRFDCYCPLLMTIACWVVIILRCSFNAGGWSSATFRPSHWLDDWLMWSVPCLQDVSSWVLHCWMLMIPLKPRYLCYYTLFVRRDKSSLALIERIKSSRNFVYAACVKGKLLYCSQEVIRRKWRMVNMAYKMHFNILF